ncbi:MAG: envelope biogenesis factor ElyC [Polyangiales bacterium]
MIGFTLKKLVGALLMPIPLTLLALCAALLLWRKRPRVARGLVGGATVWLALLSWQPVADSLLAPFEDDYPMFDVAQPVGAVVVLGGCHVTDPDMPPASQLCASSLYRLTEGLRIVAANPGAQLIVSGYSGPDSRSHAAVLREVALGMGVPAERIRAFPEPRDTAEEAAAIAPVVGDRPFALVTEASHLPRAMRFFEGHGLHPIAAPAVRMSRDDSTWGVEGMAEVKSERAFYEGLGQLWQWLRG